MYTKPLTAAASFQLKSMVDMNLETQNPHHESGKARVANDADLVLRVTDATEDNNQWSNPFTLQTPQLVNISTGQRADDKVKTQLTTVQEIGKKALEQAIAYNDKKRKLVKLNTLHTQNKNFRN